MENINCNICGGKKYKLILQQKDLYIKNKDTTFFSLVRCVNCGLIYLNPQPNNKELRSFYGANYFSQLEIDNGSKNLAENQKSKVYKFLRKMKNKVLFSDTFLFYKWDIFKERIGGKFLDIGCAEGIRDIELIRRLPEWEFYGVEPNIEAYKVAKKIKNFLVFNGTLEEAKYSDNFFDIILLSHSLEHISNPYKALQECRRILKKGGKLILIVPNINSLSYFLGKNTWRHLDIPRHLFHFSPITIKKLLEKSNFVVKKIETRSIGGHDISFGGTSNILVASFEYVVDFLLKKIKLSSELNILAEK